MSPADLTGAILGALVADRIDEAMRAAIAMGCADDLVARVGVTSLARLSAVELPPTERQRALILYRARAAQLRNATVPAERRASC